MKDRGIVDPSVEGIRAEAPSLIVASSVIGPAAKIPAIEVSSASDTKSRSILHVDVEFSGANGVNRQITTDHQNVQLLCFLHTYILYEYHTDYGRTRLSVSKLDKGYKTYFLECLFGL